MSAGSSNSEAALGDAERKHLQSQYAEIAAMAGGLAHEIKNPLSTISLNLELLVEDLEGSDNPRDKRMLRKIQTVQTECSRLGTILDEFLKFARVGQIDLHVENLNAVIQEFLDFYRPEAEGKAVEISPHLSSDLPNVRLDRSLFRQVLQNLALNAQQAMPNGGQLVVQTHVKEGRVHLDLIDTGCGMDRAVLSRMFDVFFSTKPDGSGLGLPTVQKIVRAHGGEIAVDSTPGRGTRFTISLPAA